MVLVDTSIWIHHLRRGDRRLVELLEEEAVLIHPFVLGELALGRLEQRAEILRLLGNLPEAKPATQDEVLSLIESRNLAGSGLGWVDAHLLASALISQASLWSQDRRLSKQAQSLDVAYQSGQ